MFNRYSPESLRLVSKAGEVVADSAALLEAFDRDFDSGTIGPEYHQQATIHLRAQLKASIRVAEAWRAGHMPHLEHVAMMLAAFQPTCSLHQ